MHLVGHVGHGKTFGLVEVSQSLGPIGQCAELFIHGIKLGPVKARHVLAADLFAVITRQAALAVAVSGQAAHAPHHELARAGGLEVLWPLGRDELDADAQRLHVAAPQVVELARLLVRLG